MTRLLYIVISSTAIMAWSIPTSRADRSALDLDAGRDDTVAPLVDAIQKDPCAFIRAAFGADRNACSQFRDKAGAFRIHATARVNEKSVQLLRPGDKCDGDYVAVRAVKDQTKPFLSYIDVRFTPLLSPRGFMFTGDRVSRTPPCKEPKCIEVSKGSSDSQGLLRFRDGQWWRTADPGACDEQTK